MLDRSEKPVSFVKAVTLFPSFERAPNPNRNHKRRGAGLSPMSLVFGGADAPSARGSQPRSSDIAELPKSRAQVEAIGANLRNLEAQDGAAPVTS